MATYFVDDINGLDGNSGLSELLAWQTCAKVASTTLVPLDIVQFKRGGFWPEQLVLNQSGTLGNLITYTAYGTVGSRPVISACNKLTGWTFDQAVAGGDRWYATWLTPAPNFCWIEKTDGTIVLSSNQASLVAADQVGEHFWDTATSRTYVVFATGQVPESGNTIYASKRNNSIQANASRNYLKIQSIWCRFTNNTTSGIFAIQDTTGSNTGWVIDDVYQEWCVSGFKVSGGAMANNAPITMTNCTFQFNREHGAQPEFHVNSLMDNCVFHGNGRQGLGAVWKTCVIQYCTFSYNGNKLALWPLAAPQGFDAGCYLVGSEATFEVGGSCTIQYCTAHHNTKAGFHTDALGDNNLLYRCRSYLNDLYGYFLEGGDISSSFGNKVYHCIAWGCVKDGLHLGNGHGQFDARNNIFFGNGTDATQSGFFHEYIIKALANWPIFSGTAGVDAVCTRTHVRWTPSAVALPTTPFTPLTAVGSIAAVQAAAGSWFYDGATETLYVRKADNSVVGSSGMGAKPTVATIMDYNCYATAGLIGTVKYPGGPTANFSGASGIATLFTQTGYEQHGIQADPLYGNTAAADFSLKINSPCVNAGVAIAGVNSPGFRGAAPDMGYFEVGGSVIRSIRRRR